MGSKGSKDEVKFMKDERNQNVIGKKEESLGQQEEINVIFNKNDQILFFEDSARLESTILNSNKSNLTGKKIKALIEDNTKVWDMS